jgi:hypothetical protein
MHVHGMHCVRACVCRVLRVPAASVCHFCEFMTVCLHPLFFTRMPGDTSSEMYDFAEYGFQFE